MAEHRSPKPGVAGSSPVAPVEKVAARHHPRLGALPRLTARAPVTALVVLVLAAATVYEAAVALGLISIGTLPGEGPPGEGLVLSLALLALLVGSVSAVTRAKRMTDGDPLTALLAPAAAAFVVARFYTYDPYYAPTLRRMSDGGLIPAWWVFLLVVAALLASILARTRMHAGMPPTVVVLLLSALATLFAGAGH